MHKLHFPVPLYIKYRACQNPFSPRKVSLQAVILSLFSLSELPFHLSNMKIIAHILHLSTYLLFEFSSTIKLNTSTFPMSIMILQKEPLRLCWSSFISQSVETQRCIKYHATAFHGFESQVLSNFQ